MPPADPPLPSELLSAVAVAAGPWFPADFAAARGMDRDALDDPLAALRAAGLVHVVDWVRGKGQGYAATAEGQRAAADAAVLARRLAGGRRDLVAIPDHDTAEFQRPLPAPAGLTTFDRGELARQALLAPRAAIVAPALVLANLVWFVAGILIANRDGASIPAHLRYGDLGTLLLSGGVTGGDLLRGQWWRLATACFVHAGGLHLMLNVYALGVLGPTAESLWGRWRFAAIYAVAGLCGNCFAVALRPDSLLVGASGAVWGVMAAVAVWVVLYREFLPPEVVLDALKSLGLAFLVNAAVSFAPHVSWEAHVAGGAAGLAAALLANLVRPAEVRKRVAVPAALTLALLPAAALIGLTVYAQTAADWERTRARETVRQLRGLLAPLAAIAPDAVQAVYVDAAVIRATGKTPAKFADSAAKLKAAADRARTQVLAARAGPERDAVREQAAAYATAVSEYAAAAAAGDWATAAAARLTATRAWAALNGR